MRLTGVSPAKTGEYRTHIIMFNPPLWPGLGFFFLDGKIKIETKGIDKI